MVCMSLATCAWVWLAIIAMFFSSIYVYTVVAAGTVLVYVVRQARPRRTHLYVDSNYRTVFREYRPSARCQQQDTSHQYVLNLHNVAAKLSATLRICDEQHVDSNEKHVAGACVSLQPCTRDIAPSVDDLIKSVLVSALLMI
jgi:hypothetical protein